MGCIIGCRQPIQYIMAVGHRTGTSWPVKAGRNQYHNTTVLYTSVLWLISCRVTGYQTSCYKQETLLLVNQTLLFLALSLTSVQTVTKKKFNIQCLHKIEHNLSHRDSLNLQNYHSLVPIE